MSEIFIYLFDDKGLKLERLSWALNSADSLCQYMAKGGFPSLGYLNLRKARIPNQELTHLREVVTNSSLDTLVLDGLKLSGSGVLKNLLGNLCMLFESCSVS